MRLTHYMKERIVNTAIKLMLCRNMGMANASNEGIKELEKYLNASVDITASDMASIHNKIAHFRMRE